MGLDTTAYRHHKLLPDLLEKSNNISDDDYDEFYDSLYANNQKLIFAYDNFPHALEGFGVTPFKLDAPWARDSHFLTVGYASGETGPTTQCSYSTHTVYREALCDYFSVTFGPGLSRELPFYDLIWFADNEGTLGPAACKRLLEDYQTFSVDMLGIADYPYHLARYHQQWYDAVSWAAQDGFIDFH